MEELDTLQNTQEPTPEAPVEPVEEEVVQEPLPWENAPTGYLYYEKIYDDGHLGSFTNSAETAYKLGWFDNAISEEEVQQSDINGWYYLKDKCPMKTEQDIAKDEYRAEIAELKNYLSSTDYEAIKYAEGEISAEEYEEYKQARRDARNRINELEVLINA